MIGEELKRIQNHNNGEPVLEGAKLIITVTDLKAPQSILEKTKEIMTAISQFAYTDTWPSDDEWRDILPKWFVDSMVLKTDEELLADEHQWHFESWVESMYHRGWVWWSSEIDKSTLTITLEALNLPYIFEQFLYIFYAQGIDMKNISSFDDVYGNTQH